MAVVLVAAVTVAAGGRDAIQKLQIKPEAFNLVVTVSSPFWRASTRKIAKPFGKEGGARAHGDGSCYAGLSEAFRSCPF